jgi:hypothetical protein
MGYVKNELWSFSLIISLNSFNYIINITIIIFLLLKYCDETFIVASTVWSMIPNVILINFFKKKHVHINQNNY